MSGRGEFAGRAFLLLASAVIGLAGAEVGLRVSGFDFVLAPAVQFGWPDPVTIEDAYRRDPDLLWVPPDYADYIRDAKETEVSVAFMGDSCTEFGRYPAWTMELLGGDSALAGSWLNLGVGGWSSEQGRRQLLRDVIPMNPRVVTFYYGWNDHWVALGPEDADLPLSGTLGWLEGRSRLAQVVLKARIRASGGRSTRPNRVPITRYDENLREMVRGAELAGIRPLLITAPSGHERGDEPAYLLERHLRALDDLVPMHAAYQDATRRVAREEGVALCDAAAAFAADPSPADLFSADGIHLSEAGDRKMARLVSDCIRRLGPL